MKIPPLTRWRILFTFLLIIVIIVAITYTTYNKYGTETLTDIIILQSVILTFISGIISGIPRMLYGYGSYSEEYEDFKTSSRDMVNGYDKLKESGEITPDDTGFQEVCSYLINEGNIEPSTTDKSAIRIPSPGNMRMDIQVDGELSGKNLLDMNNYMTHIEHLWENKRNRVEKQRIREYTVLSSLILSVAIFLQLIQIIAI